MSEANCPNCGGLFEFGICPYCGTVDKSSFRIPYGAPVRIVYDMGDYEYEMSIVISDFSIDQTYDTLYYDWGREPFSILGETKVTMSGIVMREDGVTMKVREKKQVK